MGCVADATNDLGNSSLDGGWAELGKGHWDLALACFERAVAKEESPEDFEGLSWAAWWLDDAEVVFAARNRAYHLYRQRGDFAGAARMATWLACDHLDFHGALAVANGWLARAHRLLDGLEPGPEHGWLAFFEGYIAGGAGETARAMELAAQAAAVGRRLGVPDLEMLGLALEGATLVACAQVEQGMRCLDEATTTALQGEAAVPISGAAGETAPVPPRGASSRAPRSSPRWRPWRRHTTSDSTAPDTTAGLRARSSPCRRACSPPPTPITR
jgi:hypothetical protein